MYNIMLRLIHEGLSNITLITALASMLCAQIIKVAYYRAVEGRFKLHHFFEAGGMPSSHSSLVVSLSMIIGLKEGFDSMIFAVVAIFSAIVMYDAIQVRAEEVGHTLVEVATGALLGLFISILVYLKFFL